MVMLTAGELRQQLGGDREWYEQVIKPLLRDLDFWMTPAVDSGRFRPRYDAATGLNAYSCTPSFASRPRPEGWIEDVLTASKGTFAGYPAVPDHAAYAQTYCDLQAGAESGLDFSSRWFWSPDTDDVLQLSLYDIATSRVAPVDLNAHLYFYESYLAGLCNSASRSLSLGGRQREELAATAQTLSDRAQRRGQAMADLMFDEDLGYWRDYDLVAGRSTPQSCTAEYATAYIPLWAGLDEFLPQYDAARFEASIPANLRALASPGGPPTSNVPSEVSGQQWDWQVWAPIVAMLEAGAERIGSSAVALEWAQAFVDSVYCGYFCHGELYEKYDPKFVGSPGSGGEYDVVSGFGWTNGVAEEFLAKYGAALVVPACVCDQD
jgi:alpha,alpha-trehalase